MSAVLRDELRALADADGVTLDQALRKLLRRERQRQMGVALAEHPPLPEDQQWLDMSADAVARG